MLSRDETDYLCRVGPGTAMGALVRSYWIPALESKELAEPDCAPVRVRLLGEDLVAFRDSSGRVGLVENACPHRGTSLYFGRNEEDGLRCAYHGWKFDVCGTCVDLPNEPKESRLKEKIKAVAYPCAERNGIVWAYLGPTPAPLLPELEANTITGQAISIRRALRRCNWVQALEGDLDSSHLSFAHIRFGMSPARVTAVPEKYAMADHACGLSCAVLRTAENEAIWRISHFLFPFYTMVPYGVLGKEVAVRVWVPIDDHHTLFWELLVVSQVTEFFVRAAPLEYLPATSDPLTKFDLVQNAGNDYRLDRQVQRSKSFMGMLHPIIEDQALTESMGPISDRTKEHLGVADVMVIQTRRRLIDAARALERDRVAPPGRDTPQAFRRRAGGIALAGDADVFEEAESLIVGPWTA